uniref:Potassium channel domain-containing protein n=1 Tax=Percolomonas cosmopolitus TaxID=63605 RepID=A0A7S1KRF2_9EUKA
MKLLSLLFILSILLITISSLYYPSPFISALRSAKGVDAWSLSDYDEEMEAFVEAIDLGIPKPEVQKEENERSTLMRWDQQDSPPVEMQQESASLAFDEEYPVNEHPIEEQEYEGIESDQSMPPALSLKAMSGSVTPHESLPHSTKIGIGFIICIIVVNTIGLCCICGCSAISKALGLGRGNLQHFKAIMSPEMKYRLLDGIHFQRQAILRKIRFNKGLAISVIMLISYVLACTVFFAIAQPGWGVIGSLYYVVTTVSTVGLGDFAVSHWYSKVFTMCVIITGMVVLAYALGLAASIIVHNQSERLAIALKSASKKGGMSNVARARVIAVFLQLAFAVVSFFFIWIVGSCIYCFFLEDWSFLDSMFFTLTVLSSVGYGTLHSTNDASRIFTMFYILFGTSTVAISIGIVSNLVLEFYQWSAVQNVRRRPLSMESDHVYDKRLDRIEFLVWSLVKSGKVEEKQCRSLLDLFEDTDVQQRGYLDASQLKDLQLPVELEDLLE